jgi:hypothetical protein
MFERACRTRCVSVALILSFWLGGWFNRADAGGTTIMKPLADPDRSLWTMPDYTVTTPGKWTIVVLNNKSIRFRSIDGMQNMQAGVVELHPKAKQTEDEAFRQYVDERRRAERENIENEALRSDAIAYALGDHGSMASWCIIDPKGASGHLTAILERKRRLLVVSYDVEKVSEADFRKDVDMVLGTMALN